MRYVTQDTSVDLSDIADHLEGVHKYDGYIVANCAFHDDSRPSMMIYPDWYRCLSCGASGRTSTLLQKLDKSHPIIIKNQGNFSNPFTGWLKERSLKQVLDTAWNTINNNPGMGNYITQDRGIIEPYRKALGIGYIDDWYTIPIRNQSGTIISAVARRGRNNSSISKYVLPNNTDPKILYIPNWKRAGNAPYLVLTFGILDAIVLAIMNIPSASTITGKTINKDSFSDFRIPIILIPDRGESHDGFSAIQKLGWRGNMARLQYPEGCKDINDIWVKDRKLCADWVKESINGIN